MGKVALTILEPRNGQRFTTNASKDDVPVAKVKLSGSVPSAGHGTLYYRWYSAIEGALNEASTGDVEIDAPLTVGSHVLTFTAKDVQGESPTEIKAVEEAGMAGGPPRAQGSPDAEESPCVVHVYIAIIVGPAAEATLSKAGATLTAVAPKQWGRPVDFNDLSKGYEPNPDYHGDEAKKKVRINKIRYRWRFRPTETPAGRPSGDLVPAAAQLKFLPDPGGKDRMVVQYQGSLPAELGTGAYTLSLRVEDEGDPTFGEETALRRVTLT